MREKRHKKQHNITRPMSHSVTGKLGQELGARTIFLLPSSFRKKRRRSCSRYLVCWNSSHCRPRTNSHKSLYFSGQTNDGQGPKHLALQGTQLKTKMLIIQWYFEVLAPTAPLWPVNIPDGWNVPFLNPVGVKEDTSAVTTSLSTFSLFPLLPPS